MFQRMMFEDTTSATSLPESADGVSPCDSPDGQTTGRPGPAVARASRTRRRAKDSETQTHATSGRSSPASSASVVLQSRLESKLRARLDTVGSIEYSQTWRQKATPAGRSYLAHTASVRRTSDSGCIGWPTPTATDGRRGLKPPRPQDTGIPLSQMVGLVLPWATPTTVTATGGAALCKWGGTSSRQRLREAVGNSRLNGALDPAFPSWLMGYPTEWSNAAASGTPSSRK